MSDEKHQPPGPARPQAAPAEQSAGPDRDVAAFLTGLAVGAVVLAVVWAVVALATGDNGDVSDAKPGLSGAHRAGSGPAGRQGPTTLERCDRTAATLEVPIKAAVPAMDQWEVHVGAMNKLVVGAITLAQATDFWNQTRAGAHQLVNAFNDADAVASSSGVRCPAPSDLPANAQHAVRICAQKVDAERAALSIARRAVGTWEIHVHHMEMLRTGSMTPARATQLWLAMWQRGVQQMKDYRVAERRAEKTGACPGMEAAAQSTGIRPAPAGSSSSHDMH